MVTFTVPVLSNQKKEQKRNGSRSVFPFAGSRHLQVPETLCTNLPHAFSKSGFSLFVGDKGHVPHKTGICCRNRSAQTVDPLPDAPGHHFS